MCKMFSVVVNCDIILVQYVHLPNSWKSTITDYGFCKVFSKILPFSNRIISNFKLFEITVNFFEYVLHLIHRSQNSILWHFFPFLEHSALYSFEKSCYKAAATLLSLCYYCKIVVKKSHRFLALISLDNWLNEAPAFALAFIKIGDR